ncbi:hypothetical protein JTE90_001977 [Oedothorax gibbosus]|uniref:Uncharacterized protein n=1 Tax=Oedothorax gibbosus TaxID=931172 RepID=A0AAV6TZ61_9ARAC|nr:hypothetical protein JTE90_001977 [Oedothorax gibbosus]
MQIFFLFGHRKTSPGQKTSSDQSEDLSMEWNGYGRNRRGGGGWWRSITVTSPRCHSNGRLKRTASSWDVSTSLPVKREEEIKVAKFYGLKKRPFVE